MHSKPMENSAMYVALKEKCQASIFLFSGYIESKVCGMIHWTADSS